MMMWLMATSMMWLTACHKNKIAKNTKQVIVDSVAVTEPDSNKDSIAVAEVVEPVKINEVAFDYLTAKSKVSFESDKQNFDNTNVNIRMKKDSLIWISVTGVGFEVARGLITSDSIIFMDKFHKQYFVFTYEQLSKKYNFELNFALLQSVIVGNLPFPAQPGDRFTKQDNFFVLSQDKGRIGVNNYVAEDNKKLTKLNARENGTDNTFALEYTDFRSVNDLLFPFTSLVMLNVKSLQDGKPANTKITLKHSRVDIQAESPGFPFSVPSGYTRKL
jgi:hypothetical protein